MTGRPGSYVVELAGVPGSGKSTVAAELYRRLVNEHVPVTMGAARTGPDVPRFTRLARKATLVAGDVASRPRLAVDVGRGLIASGERSPAQALARAVQWHVAQANLRAGSRRAGTTLLDEAVMQALWSAGLRADVSTLLRDLADHSSWHRPDVVVVLHVPPTVAATRLAARASRHSRTQALEPGAAAQEIARGADLLDRLVRWWCASADGGQLVELDAAGPVTELAGRLVDQLRPGLERSTTLS